MKLIKVFITLLIPILMSCNGSQDRIILSNTDSLLIENPAQALTILDSLNNASNLSGKDRLHLVWNRAMAHRALGMSLAEDDQLTEAIAYYRTEKEELADCYLLEASYLTWMDKEEDAVRTLDKGMSEIKDSTKLAQLQEAKARIYERQGKYSQAVEVLKEMLTYNLTKREQSMLNYKIGLNLSLLGDGQSEQFYDKGIRLAKENGDTAMACEFLRNYADYLANNGQYRRSNDIYHQISPMMPQVAEKSAIQMAMAGNYINLHRLDSARICNDNAVRSEAELNAQGYEDIARRAVIEQERYLLDYTSGKPASFTRFSRYCDSLTTDIQRREDILAQRLETKHRLQAANYELRLGRQRMGWMLSVAVLLLVGGCVGGYIYYKNKVRRLAEAEDRVDTLTRMLSEAEKADEKVDTEQSKTEDDAFFKKILLQQLGIIRLVASTPTNQNQALLKRISGIGGGEIPTNSLLVWSDLYPVIDRLYDNFHARIISSHGDTLTEKEIQICCLLCAGFSTKEIGVVTGQSDATIYVRKTSIRKKIGAAEGQDIVACINSL